jgi:hypothetical protein
MANGIANEIADGKMNGIAYGIANTKVNATP